MLERLLIGVSPEVGRILEAALEKRELRERDASCCLPREPTSMRCFAPRISHAAKTTATTSPSW